MPNGVTGEPTDLELPVERGCPFAIPTAYERLREQAPINKVRLTGGGKAWWVSRQDEARAVLATLWLAAPVVFEPVPKGGVDDATRPNLELMR